MTNTENIGSHTRSRLEGEQFVFSIVKINNSQSHEIEIKLTLQGHGWFIETETDFGYSMPNGNPIFYKLLGKAGIDYSDKLRKGLNHIWVKARKSENRNIIQDGFDSLRDWLLEVNGQSPKGKIWEGVTW